MLALGASQHARPADLQRTGRGCLGGGHEINITSPINLWGESRQDVRGTRNEDRFSDSTMPDWAENGHSLFKFRLPTQIFGSGLKTWGVYLSGGLVRAAGLAL